MVMHRFMQERRAFTVFLKQYPDSKLVQEYYNLMRTRVPLWQQCIDNSFSACKRAFIASGRVPNSASYIKDNMFLRFLANVHVGNVDLVNAKAVQCNDAVGEWLSNDTYVWTF